MMQARKAARRLHQVQRILDGGDCVVGPTSSWNRVLVLPDDSIVYASEPTATGAITIALDSHATIAYRILNRTEQLVLSALGTPYEKGNPVPRYPILELLTLGRTNQADVSTSDVWAWVYALWTLFHTQENIPVIFASSGPDVDAIVSYLTCSGLARSSLLPEGRTFFLLRGTFWQGAGSGPAWGNNRGWLRYTPHFYTFPHSQTFTRNLNVISQHPLRPPKPPRGTVVYKRFCAEIGRVLAFHVMDPEDPADVDAFHSWMNNERVDNAWEEKGDMGKHRAYIEKTTKDPAALPLIMSWDGERMGYCEVVWIKENHVAPYIPSGARNYDRGMHVLLGEEKFRGRIYSKLWFRTILHYIFLADARTERMIGEPRSNNTAAISLGHDCLTHSETSFYFPYKHSSLEVGLRERFFKEDMLL